MWIPAKLELQPRWILSRPQAKDSFSYELMCTLSLFFIVLFTLPSWQLLYPNKSLHAFYLPVINVVSQNCKTQNTPLTMRVIPEQFQTPSERSFRTLLTSISVL